MKAAFRPRAVYDTNVLPSALAFHGETRRLWALVEEGRVALSVSEFILDELGRNLTKKAGLRPEEAAVLLDEVRLHSRLVHPLVRVEVVRRKDADNRILECALAAGADVLVTGDLKDLRPIEEFRGVRIQTPREFLSSL